MLLNQVMGIKAGSTEVVRIYVDLSEIEKREPQDQYKHFARTRSQGIYVFPVLYNRVRTAGPLLLCAEDFCSQN